MCCRIEARRGRIASGFTLLEVLVALTLIAVALMASLRAVGALAQGAGELQARTLAQWSAENRLAEVRIEGRWPELGPRSWDCSQGAARLRCEETVFQTPNADFRRIEVSVYPTEGVPVRLARLVGFATRLRR